MTWLEFWSSFKSENHFPPFCEIFTFCDRLEDGSIQKVSGQGVMCPNPPTFNVKFGSIIPKLTEWQSWISHWKVIHSTSMFPILLHETDVGRTRATVDGVMVHLSYVQWDIHVDSESKDWYKGLPSFHPLTSLPAISISISSIGSVQAWAGREPLRRL